jgi:hypothetical protein
MADVLGHKDTAASWTRALTRQLTTAMRIERGVAVRADDPKVLEPVVVRGTIDVVEDQRHTSTLPKLALAAELADRFLQPRSKQPLLEMPTWITGVLHEHLLQRSLA